MQSTIVTEESNIFDCAKKIKTPFEFAALSLQHPTNRNKKNTKKYTIHHMERNQE